MKNLEEYHDLYLKTDDHINNVFDRGIQVDLLEPL